MQNLQSTQLLHELASKQAAECWRAQEEEEHSVHKRMRQHFEDYLHKTPSRHSVAEYKRSVAWARSCSREWLRNRKRTQDFCRQHRDLTMAWQRLLLVPSIVLQIVQAKFYHDWSLAFIYSLQGEAQKLHVLQLIRLTHEVSRLQASTDKLDSR